MSEYICYNTLSLHLHITITAHPKVTNYSNQNYELIFPLNSLPAALYSFFWLLSSKSWSIWLTVGAQFGGMDK